MSVLYNSQYILHHGKVFRIEVAFLSVSLFYNLNNKKKLVLWKFYNIKCNYKWIKKYVLCFFFWAFFGIKHIGKKTQLHTVDYFLMLCHVMSHAIPYLNNLYK